MLPDIIIAGTQRGGTTSLYTYLTRHPDINAPERKEISYFNENFGRGRAWYESCFPSSGRSLDATPLYLSDPSVTERMKALIPDARIVVLLRNPVDRFHSAYQLDRLKRPDRALPTIDATVDKVLAGWNATVGDFGEDEAMVRLARSPLAIGFYASHLRRWFGHFDTAQFLLLRSEDFYRKPSRVYARVLRFLELRPHRSWTFPVFKVGPASYEDMSTESRGRLSALYEPHNERLRELCGFPGW